MSILGAMFSGVSGLNAQSQALGAIADNITNQNTIGYKATEVRFQTLVTSQASLNNYSPGGVQQRPFAAVDVKDYLHLAQTLLISAFPVMVFLLLTAPAHMMVHSDFHLLEQVLLAPTKVAISKILPVSISKDIKRTL